MLGHVGVSICLVLLAPVAAEPPLQQVAARAFEPYEAVRVALAADKLDGIGAQAATLASRFRTVQEQGHADVRDTTRGQVLGRSGLL